MRLFRGINIFTTGCKEWSKICGFYKHRINLRHRQCVFFLFVVIILIVFCNILNEFNQKVELRRKLLLNNERNGYTYLLINNTEVTMDLQENNSSYTSYAWFQERKHLFKNLGAPEAPKYRKSTPSCKLDLNSLGPIHVRKELLKLRSVVRKHLHVKLGGFYAPRHCRPSYRVAILVPYRNLKRNLGIFLYYIHRLMKIQLLEYRIFVVEQYGKENFNRGMLFNVGYLESERFGSWDCIIFHDVDAVPEDDRILYNCYQSPRHFATAVEQFQYKLRYEEQFGCVSAMTPAQFEAVNGYSNFYWSWGGEDDDMSARIKFTNMTISRYPAEIGRYASLTHEHSATGQPNTLFVLLCRQRYKTEGLKTTNYKLIAVIKRILYTHIIVDLNPLKLKLDEKHLMSQMLNISKKEDLLGYRYTFMMHKAKQTSMNTDFLTP